MSLTMKIVQHLILFIFFILVITSCKEDKKATTETGKLIRVGLVSVSKKEISRPIHTSGILSSKELIKLSFKIAGIIRHIHVDEGKSVQRGEMLAQLELAEINAKLQRAQTSYEKNLNDYQRAKNLYADSVVTIEQLQNARSLLKVGEADLEIAKFNYEHASIKAPVAGKITRRFAGENEIVAPGTPILHLASTEENLIVRVGLTEKDILKLQIGDSAKVSFDAYPGEVFTAKVQEIAAALDIQSGTYEVEMAVEATAHRLLTGFTASVTIFPSQAKTYQLIPIESLARASGYEGYVYTLTADGQRAALVPIKVAFVYKNQVAVASGLETVKEVVNIGTEYLFNNAKVEVIGR